MMLAYIGMFSALLAGVVIIATPIYAFKKFSFGKQRGIVLMAGAGTGLILLEISHLLIG